MRTTLTPETDLAPAPRPYRLQPVSLGGVLPGVDLDKALRLAESLEDEAIAQKLEHVNPLD